MRRLTCGFSRKRLCGGTRGRHLDEPRPSRLTDGRTHTLAPREAPGQGIERINGPYRHGASAQLLRWSSETGSAVKSTSSYGRCDLNAYLWLLGHRSVRQRLPSPPVGALIIKASLGGRVTCSGQRR